MDLSVNGLTRKTPLVFSLPIPFSKALGLVIDDSLDCQQIAMYGLEQLGCECICATTASEGLLSAIAHIPSIILLDFVLPDYSGFKFLKLLRQNSRTAQLPVVAITAMAQATDRDKMLEAGCTAYITKPYLIKDFMQILRPLLGHSLKDSPAKRLIVDFRTRRKSQ